MRYALLFLFLFASFTLVARADDSASGCPMHNSHSSDFDAMNKRGDAVMGFSQDKATHHFSVTSEGGRISIIAKDSKDTDTIEQIQMHLQHVAHAFENGDFAMPHEIHQETPPGVVLMQEQKEKIRYRFVKDDAGASVEIQSDDPEVRSAIHRFLDFQIREHHTGDKE